MITESDERRAPSTLEPHSDWHLAQAAERLLIGNDAAAHAIELARSVRRPENDPAPPSRAARRPVLDAVPPAHTESPQVTAYGPLFRTAGCAIVAVTGALSATASHGTLPGPAWAGILVTAGTGALAGLSAVIVAADGRSPLPDRRPSPALVPDGPPYGTDDDQRDAHPGRQPAYPDRTFAEGRPPAPVADTTPYGTGNAVCVLWRRTVRTALVLAGAAACVVTWVVLLTGLVASPGLVAVGVALPELVAFAALPLATGRHRARRRVRALARWLSGRRAARRSRNAHARARRALLDHERAWHRVVRAARTQACALPGPDRDAVHAVLTALATGEFADAVPLPSTVAGPLQSAVHLLGATEPARLRRQLNGESGMAGGGPSGLDAEAETQEPGAAQAPGREAAGGRRR